MAHVPMRDVLEGLLERMDADDLAELSGDMVWKLHDNGSEMFDVFVDWLDSDDPEHIEAALLANDGFLFRDRASMQKKFDELVRRMPRFEERTSEILRAWDAQFGDKAFDELLAGTRTVESVARLLGVSEEETRSRANAYRQAHSGE